jgi:hypothetical protein
LSTASWTLAEISAAILANRTDSAAELANQVKADVKPSTETIEKWRAYLPEDCVNTMIKMGWDKTD